MGYTITLMEIHTFIYLILVTSAVLEGAAAIEDYLLRKPSFYIRVLFITLLLIVMGVIFISQSF